MHVQVYVRELVSKHGWPDNCTVIVIGRVRSCRGRGGRWGGGVVSFLTATHAWWHMSGDVRFTMTGIIQKEGKKSKIMSVLEKVERLFFPCFATLSQSDHVALNTLTVDCSWHFNTYNLKYLYHSCFALSLWAVLFVFVCIHESMPPQSQRGSCGSSIVGGDRNLCYI